jgi:WD40 repeat protein
MALERLQAGTPFIFHSWLCFDPLWLFLLEKTPYQTAGWTKHECRLWDSSSGECLQTLEGHSDWVSSVAFSHDSARLASASDDNTVKIWDASSDECLQTLEGLAE